MTVLNLGLLSLKTLQTGVMNDYLNNVSKSIKTPLFDVFIGLCNNFYDTWKKGNYSFNDLQLFLDQFLGKKVQTKWNTYLKTSQKDKKKD